MYKCKCCEEKFEQPIINNVPLELEVEQVRCCPNCGVIEQFEERKQDGKV